MVPITEAAQDAAATIAPGVPSISVRRASVRDLEFVMELRLALLREYPDHPIYGRLRADISRRARDLFSAQLRAPGESIFIADVEIHASRRNGVGILRCVESTGSPLLEPSRYAYVSSVYVRPDVRRHGVLRALMLAADNWSRARGLDEMRLHNVVGNESAERAWSALGFQVVEQVRVKRLGAPAR